MAILSNKLTKGSPRIKTKKKKEEKENVQRQQQKNEKSVKISEYVNKVGGIEFGL